MARDGVAVDADVAAVAARMARGERVNVSAEARRLGVHRQTLHKYAGRVRVEGVDGLYPRSRRPRSSPRRLPAHVEDEVVACRKELAGQGLDNGATSIRYRLLDHPELLADADGVAAAVPSRASINRILAARGLLQVVPARRPRAATRRFARSRINELWQLDGWDTRLADGAVVTVLEIFDDCSRMLLAAHAATSENATDTQACFQAAVAYAGGRLPTQLLTDNAGAFNGSRRGFTAPLEAMARSLGVDPISSSIGHPQTNGKVERGHQTSQRWLAAHDAPANLAQLQRLLEEFQHVYNHHRRHQALHGTTPAEAWAQALEAGLIAGPAADPLPEATVITTHTVATSGCIGVDGTEISLGKPHRDQNAVVFRTGDQATVFINGHYDHDRTLDRTRRYQPRHTPTARP